MSEDTKDAGTRFSLSRWSQRKRAIARGETVGDGPRAPAASAQPPAAALAPAAAAAPALQDPPLPSVESLSFDSDFTVFMTTKVDESVKRAALRTLLRDPRFNVMDGLDVYIDDYSLPDPIPPSMLAQLQHSKDVLNPVFADVGTAPPSAQDETSATSELAAAKVASGSLLAGLNEVAQAQAATDSPIKPAAPEDDATNA